ncbi:MAG: hypothetical protein FJ038_13695, partial [Chloroflexi bacterium]|nr:hypothetical protein [Chloroflexota bacterium]
MNATDRQDGSEGIVTPPVRECKRGSGQAGMMVGMVDAAGPGRRFPKTEAKKARQRAFLELVEQGLTYTAAAKALGIHITTYERWRREEQAFRTQVDALRASQMDRREDLSPADWDGTFASARKIFFGYDTYWHQREIIYAIERAQPGEVVLILTPPETGKTSLLEDKMCLDLGQNPNKRITYVSESQIRTRKIAGRLQRRMTDGVVYPDFIKRFGPFYMPGQERRGKPWAADCFTVYGSDHDERDYSFEGRGWRSAVAGTRTDEMLIDDVQSLRSLNLTADILERLRQDFFSRPGRNGRICIVMTRVGNNDVPEQLWETGIVTEANTVRLPMVDEQGKSLCPEMWPDEDLVAKRLLVGEAAWFRNYMQQPRLAGNATFTEAMIEGCWDLRARGESELLNRVMMVDPALTGGCAIGVAAYDAERYQMLDFEYRFNMARVEEILVVLERFAEMYKPQDLVVETNAFQRGLGNDERLLAISRR